jgi:hypothetical protein
MSKSTFVNVLHLPGATNISLQSPCSRSNRQHTSLIKKNSQGVSSKEQSCENYKDGAKGESSFQNLQLRIKIKVKHRNVESRNAHLVQADQTAKTFIARMSVCCHPPPAQNIMVMRHFNVNHPLLLCEQ